MSWPSSTASTGRRSRKPTCSVHIPASPAADAQRPLGGDDRAEAVPLDFVGPGAAGRELPALCQHGCRERAELHSRSRPDSTGRPGAHHRKRVSRDRRRGRGRRSAQARPGRRHYRRRRQGLTAKPISKAQCTAPQPRQPIAPPGRRFLTCAEVA
jgi:hypothetical protein